jgi:nitric oxide reductase subunit B
MGYTRESWFWFGNQGLSYIQLGRAWQIGFFAGLAIWSILVFRALWPTRTTLFQATRQFWSGRIRLEHLIWASTVNIALLYVLGMIPLTGIEKSFTITDFWRWWVVHLWVEQSFEFFAAAISAYLLMAVGLVSRQLAERSVYLARPGDNTFLFSWGRWKSGSAMAPRAILDRVMWSSLTTSQARVTRRAR